MKMIQMTKILKICAMVLASLSCLNGFAQIQAYNLTNKNVLLYEKAEWDIQIKADWTNPYLYDDIALDLVVIPENGKRYKLPCYYVNGAQGEISNWKARLSPQEAGMHQYYFVLVQRDTKTDSSAISQFIVQKSDRKGILKVANNWSLQYSNGEYFRGIGQNIGWESRDEDDSKFFKELHENPKYNYEYMLKTLAENGGNFFRTWMCQWNLPIEWKITKNNSRYHSSPEHFNPSAIVKMDRLVELCDSLNVHMMLAIDAHVNLMGEFWSENNYQEENGGPAKNASDFFTNDTAKKQYKSKLRYLIARWGYSPAIGAWEFFNEIDHVVFGPKDTIFIDHAIVTSWHKEMSDFLKKTDTYRHIVTTSISHREIKGLNTIDNIDINQKHIYCNTDGIPQAIVEKLSHGKPYIIGEYGYHWDWSLNFNEFATEFDRDFKRGLWYGAFTPTPVFPMTWWWEFFDNRGTIVNLKLVRRISDLMLAAGKGEFEQYPVDSGNEKVKTYGVKCGKKVFVYMVNISSSDISFNLPLPKHKDVKAYYQFFDTNKGSFSLKRKTPELNNMFLLENIKLSGNSDIIAIFGE
jgi:hypothetical protein